MLSIYSRHYNVITNQWESISAHVFTKNKDTYSDFKTGMLLIKEELEKREIPFRKMIKLTDNCSAEFKSRFVFGALKYEDMDVVGVYKTPGKYQNVFLISDKHGLFNTIFYLY